MAKTGGFVGQKKDKKTNKVLTAYLADREIEVIDHRR